MALGCSRCDEPETVIMASAFCPDCYEIPLCVRCFALHVVENIDDIEPKTDFWREVVTNV